MASRVQDYGFTIRAEGRAFPGFRGSRSGACVRGSVLAYTHRLDRIVDAFTVQGSGVVTPSWAWGL